MIHDKIESERYTLYLADCMDVLPTLGQVDAVVTDPPYGIFACGGKWGRKQDLQWDRKPVDDIGTIVSLGRDAIWRERQSKAS